MRAFTGASRILWTALLLLALPGCSIFKWGDDGTSDYARAAAIKSLEAPEGLIAPGQLSRQFDIPGEGGESVKPAQVGNAPLLPDTRRLRLEKDGALHWLSATVEPRLLWPHLENFWKVRGIKIERSDKRKGVVYTDWKITSQGEEKVRHQFTMRLKPTAYSSGGQSKIGSKVFITAISSKRSGREWLRLPADPKLEARMLGRLQAYLAGL